MSLLLIDLSGKNDTRCTVGNKARRKSLPWLLMTLLRSIPHGALYFLLHSLNFCPWLSSISHPVSCLSAILYKNMFQLKMSCWPTLSICCLQFLLQTNRMAWPLSLTVCSADRSMGITVNTLSCFCWVVEFVDAGYSHQLLSSLPDQGFVLPGDSLSIPSCSKWSESLSAKSMGFSCSSYFLVYYLLTGVDNFSSTS